MDPQLTRVVMSTRGSCDTVQPAPELEQRTDHSLPTSDL